MEPKNAFDSLSDLYGFQYNICTCGALADDLKKLEDSNFNTTFVHVERLINT